MKTCPRCGEAKPLDQFHRDASRQDGLWLWCKACGRETQRRYRQKNPERARERSRRWHEENRDRAAAYGRRWVQENPDRARELPRLRRERLRTAVFDHYGQACACCGTAENLSIDHVNGDGTEHRMELFGSSNVSTGMYLWLIRNGFPAGFRRSAGRATPARNAVSGATWTMPRHPHRRRRPRRPPYTRG